jgi:hypothetical protein
MKKHLFLVASVAALVLTLALAVGTAVVAAKTPTPTSTASVTPTPAGQVPAAPSDLRVSATSMTWTDNSNNEDGFLIDLTVFLGNEFQQDLHYQVPANTMSFTFPPDYFTAQNRCLCGGGTWRVTAFNSFGSATAAVVIVGIPSCVPAVTATPAAVTLPGTGSGHGGPGPGWQMTILTGGIALMGVGTVLFARARRSRQKR